MNEMSMEEMMEMMAEDEEQVQAHPCCSNCLHCHMTYGQLECYYEGEEEACAGEFWDPSATVCRRWRSDITGMPASETSC